jgi:UDP-glucose 4-epimerase
MATQGAYVTVISAFLRARMRGEPLIIYGDGDSTRDFTHVRDVVSANLLAMNASTADGRALNIGQGQSVSVNWVAERIGGPIVYKPARPGDVRHTLADYSQAEHVLGWKPQVSTPEGLDELLEALHA